MATAIRLNSQNIHITAAMADISVEELLEKKNEAEKRHRSEQEKQWAIDYLGKDEEWYARAIEKIKIIDLSLPKGMHYKERTIKMYGWIADTIKHKNLSIPLESDIKFARADCIQLILTNPTLYLKIINWD